MITHRMAAIGLMAICLSGCGNETPQQAPVRPVRVTVVEKPAAGETLALTGHIRAEVQTCLAFRTDGRLLERMVNIGDTVRSGQVIGRLDPQIQRNLLRQAKADLSAAQGQLVQARNDFERQRTLLADGFSPKARFDQMQQALLTTEARVESAKAQLRNAEEQLGFTELRADADGTVTAIGAEPGEVVGAGRMIAEVAQRGGRDAVFDVPAQLIRTAPPDPHVDITLSDDPRITARGRVREIAPQADAVTRTYPVKVGLIDPPAAMRLGATVTGRVVLPAPTGMELPASALTSADGRPAVWVVEPQARTVALRNVEIARHDPASIIVASGLEAGDIVVTAGVQALHPGQKVRLPGDAK